MIERRGLKIGSFDTAAYGFTMTKLVVEVPEAMNELVEVEGMSGALDFSEATGGTVYKTARLEAVFELSVGKKPDRERIIAELIRAAHGKSCPIVHPDHGGKVLTGRVQVQKDYSDLAHACVTVTAVCQPWYAEPHEAVCEIPIRERSYNRITFDNTEAVDELTTCNAGRTGDTEVVTVTLGTTAGEIHSRAVWRVKVEPNERYFVSARLIGSGFWRVSATEDMPEQFSSVVQTGDSGHLYFFVERLQSYGAVSLADIVVLKGSDAQMLHNASFPVSASVEHSATARLLVCIDGRLYVLHEGAKRVQLPAGDVPVAVFRCDSVGGGTATVKFTRRWLE